MSILVGTLAGQHPLILQPVTKQRLAPSRHLLSLASCIRLRGVNVRGGVLGTLVAIDDDPELRALDFAHAAAQYRPRAQWLSQASAPPTSLT